MKRPGLVARLRRRTGASFLLGALLAILLIGVVNGTSVYEWVGAPLWRSDTSGRADAIIVIGAGIEDGCQPNISGLERTRLAVRAFKSGRAPHLLFTGGTVAASEHCSVADVMSGFARELGVPSEAIWLEAASRSTWENAEQSAEILRSRGVTSVLIVTDALHMRRAEDCFRHFGFLTERASVPQPLVSCNGLHATRYALRELVAVAVYRWKGRFAAPPADPGAERPR